MERKHIEDFEIKDIAKFILGFKTDSDIEETEIEESLADKYDLHIDDFGEIVERLYSMLHLSVSPLTSTPIIGFADKDNDVWLVKQEIESNFIKATMDYLCDCDYDELNKSQGFAKDIKNKKGNQYDYSLQIKNLNYENKKNQVKSEVNKRIDKGYHKSPEILAEELFEEFQENQFSLEDYQKWVSEILNQ